MRGGAVTGAKHVAARLEMLIPAMEGVAAEAVYASAGRCAEIARDLVPVDNGALQGSIDARATGEYSASVTASAPYAAMVEYGTSKMAAQPYMLPAAHRAAESFFENARTEARRAAKEV